jgi:hypothetical protein
LMKDGRRLRANLVPYQRAFAGIGSPKKFPQG